MSVIIGKAEQIKCRDGSVEVLGVFPDNGGGSVDIAVHESESAKRMSLSLDEAKSLLVTLSAALSCEGGGGK